MSKFDTTLILLTKYDELVLLLTNSIEDLYQFKHIEYNEDEISIEYESYEYNNLEHKTFSRTEIEILLKNFEI